MTILNKKSSKKTRKITKIVNNKPELTISKLKQIYKDIISSKNVKYNKSNFFSKLKQIYKDIISSKNVKYNKNNLLVFIFNYYLLLKGYRSIFQTDYKNPEELEDIKKSILNKYNIKYIVRPFSTNSWRGLIIYNDKKIKIDDIDKTFGEKFADQLGDFYICASSNWSKYNNKYRINISVASKVDKFAIELYGQMCVSVNDKQIIKLKKIARNISVVVKQFDKNCITTLKITDRTDDNKNIIFKY
jgi:hypothetical protein